MSDTSRQDMTFEQASALVNAIKREIEKALLGQEAVIEQGKAMRAYFLDGLFSLQDIPGVTNIRGYGMMGGIEVAQADKPGIRGIELTKVLWDMGLHIKFTGDCGVVAPPLVAQKSHIDEMIDKFAKAFKTI